MFNEKLIPFTPRAIMQGIIMNSLGKMANKLKIAPLSPKIFIINPEVNPVIKPLVTISRKIKGIPIIVIHNKNPTTR